MNKIIKIRGQYREVQEIILENLGVSFTKSEKTTVAEFDNMNKYYEFCDLVLYYKRALRAI